MIVLSRSVEGTSWVVSLVVVEAGVVVLCTHRQTLQPPSSYHSIDPSARHRQLTSGHGSSACPVVATEACFVEGVSVRGVVLVVVVAVLAATVVAVPGSRTHRQTMQPLSPSLVQAINESGLHLHLISPLSGQSDLRCSFFSVHRQVEHPSTRSHTSISHDSQKHGSTTAQPIVD